MFRCREIGMWLVYGVGVVVMGGDMQPTVLANYVFYFNYTYFNSTDGMMTTTFDLRTILKNYYRVDVEVKDNNNNRNQLTIVFTIGEADGLGLGVRVEVGVRNRVKWGGRVRCSVQML